MTETREILECGHPESEHSSIARGYGTDDQGNRHCYDCCAKRDREQMLETGKATLYLTLKDAFTSAGNPSGKVGTITNWPGSLTFPTGLIRKGRHNMARVRYDTWFTGPDGKEWHAVQYGDNTQIAHCKRTKAA